MNEKKLRIFEILLVLSIGFLPTLILSFWSIFSQTPIKEFQQYSFPEYFSLIIESLLAIILMFYVLSKRQKTVSSIGVNSSLSLIDLFYAVAIIIAVVLI